MKNPFLFICLSISVCLTFSCARNTGKQDDNLKLWYNKPAEIWEEALPVGNGRLGAMIFGDPVHEKLQLNEESIWAGSKLNNNNQKALEALTAIQKAIFESRYDDAFKLADANFLGTPPRIRSYQPLGDLLIDYEWNSDPENFRRELDLENGITTSSFRVDGKNYRQETFASAPDNIIVIRISSPDNGTVNASFRMTREKDASISCTENKILLTGQIIDEEDSLSGPGGEHMKFAGEVRLDIVKGNTSISDNKLIVSEAEEIIIRLTAATDYNFNNLDLDRTVDPAAVCKSILDKSDDSSFDDLKKRHLSEYQGIFNRISLNFEKDSLSRYPVDERLARLKKGGSDNGLMALYFQYGRYLLMSSSRAPGILPANLQGIWNKDLNAPWNSDFHTNINLQMNYWPAEVCNLSETTAPLIAFMEKLQVPGSATAREMYGTKGWVIHHLTDPFGRTGVADGVWGITPMNGPWMTFPVYEHFLFTSDTSFLRNIAYPLMKGSAEFVLGFLVESPDGYLVTNPSHSPENNFRDPASGEISALTYAATTDIEIINALFDNCIQASEILGSDSDFAEKLKQTKKRLPPIVINSRGVIQEWIKDYDEPEPGHRHMSHLLGLYPLSQFTPETPGLYNAARATIERRLSYGGGHTGWSRSWIINFYARLHDGEKAYENLTELLRKSTLNNLFDTHPPFQIDGNFGGTAGIAEMLIQSHGDKIRLLPALPAEWSEGEVKGLCARGGFVIDMKWNASKLENASVFSEKGGKCLISYKGVERKVDVKAGRSVNLKF